MKSTGVQLQLAALLLWGIVPRIGQTDEGLIGGYEKTVICGL